MDGWIDGWMNEMSETFVLNEINKMNDQKENETWMSEVNEIKERYDMKGNKMK